MKKIVNYNILISAIFALFIVISLTLEKLLNTQMFYSTNIIPIISIIYGIANIVLIILSKAKKVQLWETLDTLFHEIIILEFVLVLFGIIMLYL